MPVKSSLVAALTMHALRLVAVLVGWRLQRLLNEINAQSVWAAVLNARLARFLQPDNAVRQRSCQVGATTAP